MVTEDISPLIVMVIPLLTVVAYIWKQAWWLSDRFKEMSNVLTSLLDKHEDKDQQRHLDNVIRLTKLETKIDIIGNGKLQEWPHSRQMPQVGITTPTLALTLQEQLSNPALVP